MNNETAVQPTLETEGEILARIPATVGLTDSSDAKGNRALLVTFACVGGDQFSFAFHPETLQETLHKMVEKVDFLLAPAAPTAH